MKRFWDKVDKHSGTYGDDGQYETECWTWTASLKNGYGELWYIDKRWYTHRLSWLLHFGELFDGICVLHKCDNRKCVRPDHLFLGTKGDNNRDTAQKGRTRGGSDPGEACGASKLNNEQVLAIRTAYQNGDRQRQIARQFSIGKTTVASIVTRRTWRHI